MNKGSFHNSFNNSVDLLKGLNLYKSLGKKKLGSVSDEFKKASQIPDYIKLYNTAINHLDYDILLSDNSFFQFNYLTNKNQMPYIRYGFYLNPQEYIDYSTFLREIVKTTFDEVGENFKDYYDQYLNESTSYNGGTVVRYDLDANSKNYKPLIHPASHFHIGIYNDIRIPCDKIASPLSFVLFILKNFYFVVWKDLIEKENRGLLKHLSLNKTSCKSLEKDFFQNVEKGELYIT